MSDVDASFSSSSALGCLVGGSAGLGVAYKRADADAWLVGLKTVGRAIRRDRCNVEVRGLDSIVLANLLVARSLLNLIQDLMLLHNSLRSLVIAGPVSRCRTPFL